jgi:hypothetical protein
VERALEMDDKPKEKTANEEYRDYILEAFHDASQDFDKAIMTLSGGALALSVTFIHDIVASPLPGTIIALWFGWCSLAASLITIMISYVSSMSGMTDILEDVNEAIKKNNPIVPSPKSKRANRITIGFNNASWIFLVVGIISLAVFAILNY